MKKEKVFGIGLSRTGTTSLNGALIELGYNSKHFPNEIIYNTSFKVRIRERIVHLLWKFPLTRKIKKRFIEKILKDTKNNLILKKDEIRKWDALTDTPVTRFYKQIDEGFPNSKFILTTRNIETWLNSCEKIFNLNEYRTACTAQLHKDLYNSLVFDRAKFKKAFLKHEKEVFRYFNNREKDLLILNIEEGDGWEKLCNFLKKPIPNKKFPHENKSSKIK